MAPCTLTECRMLTRRQAAHLCKSYTTVDPSVWAPHFLQKWSQYVSVKLQARELGEDISCFFEKGC